MLDARDLGPRIDAAGQPMSPIFPALAAAQAAGEVSEEHVAIVIRTVDELPSDIQSEALERELTRQATKETPDRLRARVRDLKHRLDPDDAHQRAADHDRRREVTLHRHADGSAELSGHLTPEAGIKWQTILSALSAPAPAADGTPDERTAGQRRHDGFLQVADKVMAAGSLPDCGGTAVTLIIHASADQIAGQGGELALTEHGDLLDTQLLLRLAGEADTYLAFTDLTDQLHLGRSSRLAKPALRRALAARDGGCSFPDCDVPSSWTQAHHVRAWIADGETEIDNLTLLCGYHHREHQRLGWTCEIRNNVVWWIAPPDASGDRQPLRNTRRSVRDYDFATSHEPGRSAVAA